MMRDNVADEGSHYAFDDWNADVVRLETIDIIHTEDGEHLAGLEDIDELNDNECPVCGDDFFKCGCMSEEYIQRNKAK